MTFKPMLAATVDKLDTLRFPLLASTKLDGIRAIVRNGQLVSRSLKPIPNHYTQSLFGIPEFEGLDGELIVGTPWLKDVFRNTTSAVMAHDGCPDVRFYVFDDISDDNAAKPFIDRMRDLERRPGMGRSEIVLVAQRMVHSIGEVVTLEHDWLTRGYEGVMLRDPQGRYKNGRSTLKEHGLLKLKQFADAEAVITKVVEQRHNGNEATINALGQTERSTKKAGMTGKGTLGALEVIGINGTYDQVEFSIGTGFDDSTRQQLWAARTTLPGLMVKYKFFPSGSKDAPRFPVFMGFRDPRDL